MRVFVEFFGVPRLRVAISETVIEFDRDVVRLGDVITHLAARFPQLAEDCFDGERLDKSVTASLDGKRFVRDPETPLRGDDRLLLLSADSGG
jgi:hypothetical protein